MGSSGINAMYMMISIELINFPEFDSDLQFVEKLVFEQSVMCLPGRCFDVDNFIRIVLTVPKQTLMEALNRMHQFCVKHYVNRKQILKQSIFENEKCAEPTEKIYKYLKNHPTNRKISGPNELISNMVN